MTDKNETFRAQEWTRRGLAVGASAMALASATPARAQSAISPEDASALAESFQESDSEEPVPENAHMTMAAVSEVMADYQNNLFETRWPPDRDCPDFLHLRNANGVIAGSSAPFELTPAVLESYLAHSWLSAKAFEAGDTVIVGIRAATPLATQIPAIGNAIKLVETTPDHSTFQCTICIWNRSTGSITAFRASTVPAGYFMYGFHTEKAYIDKRGKRQIAKANMMPTGVYRYVIGTHNGNQPRVLRLDDRVLVQRLKTRTDLGYVQHTLMHDVTNDWTPKSLAAMPGNVSDNLHAASFDTSSLPWKFSSAGCQVIPGGFQDDAQAPGGRRSLRDIAKFQSALAEHIGDLVDGTQMRYVLATGRELRLHAARLAGGAAQSDVDPTLVRLRQGSRHPANAAIQAKLATEAGVTIVAPSEFDAKSTQLLTSVLAHHNSGRAFAVLTPASARAYFGLTLA